VIYLDLEDLLHIAERVLGEIEVRDVGLLDAAAARPQTSAFGEDAYPTIHEKAGALVHSLARNRALVDGNKRLALAATIAFYGVNGLRLTMTNDEAYDFITAVAAGEIDDVQSIAKELGPHGVQRASGRGRRRTRGKRSVRAESGRRESNPHHQLGRLELYH
jgi:death on curing protein